MYVKKTDKRMAGESFINKFASCAVVCYELSEREMVKFRTGKRIFGRYKIAKREELSPVYEEECVASVIPTIAFNIS